MPTLTKCSGKKCSIKEKCFRYTSVPKHFNQSYFPEVPLKENGTCDYFLQVDIKIKAKI
jgi:hypothetical protein